MGTLRIFNYLVILLIILLCFVYGTNGGVGGNRKTKYTSNGRTYGTKSGNKIASLNVAGPERESEFGTRGKSELRLKLPCSLICL